MLESGARLQVVDAFHIRNTRTEAGIGQRTVLSHRLFLQIWREIVEWVGAGVIVVLVAADESAQGENRIGAEDASPGRRNIEGLDLRTLIRRTHGKAVGAKSAIVDDQPGPRDR